MSIILILTWGAIPDKDETRNEEGVGFWWQRGEHPTTFHRDLKHLFHSLATGIVQTQPSVGDPKEISLWLRETHSSDLVVYVQKHSVCWQWEIPSNSLQLLLARKGTIQDFPLIRIHTWFHTLSTSLSQEHTENWTRRECKIQDAAFLEK